MTTQPQTSREFVDAVTKLLDLHKHLELVRMDANTGEVTFRVITANYTGLSDIEIDFIKKNQKINAIKAYRERTHCGLADAKKKIEEYMDLGRVPF